ncbi:alcohol dehydrogenase YqhD (iron-dependent ADH family) [Mycoplasmoides fastidiosum]|uniref:Alcohol dehydrogenase YqhD (Iron-dependent ADH family) n=1 Tax=Mycoplasmoides fastidiosum TaxID=92758 RepID=A0ABU0LZG3_9BACT|nr:iron-containing alcohol dehydrogenase [Mycoplasmoides fastidiosum]MDQ0514084.1 alcohol dehydrogenase YqhD (iron-dependent ADH family) [Mycoplasmoides fastidiosum]UUD37506.1 iron-containing alcohol dehydrogenase [Mycoplasmoides fastidiosum]
MAKVKTTTTKKKNQELKNHQIKVQQKKKSVPVVTTVEVKEQEMVQYQDVSQDNALEPNIFLTKQNQIFDLLKFSREQAKVHRIVSKEQLRRLIVQPQISSISNLTNLVRLKSDFVYKSEDELYQEYLAKIEIEQTQEPPRDDDYVVEVEKSAPYLADYVVSSKVFEKYLPEELLKKGAKKILILTDTDFQQTTHSYQLLVRALRQHGIFFVEYTNIQPEITKKLVWDVAAFGHEHDVDSVIAFGSWSLIDFSKIVTIKMSNPNLKRLNRASSETYTRSNYFVFSIPTLVCMEDGVNSSSVLFNEPIKKLGGGKKASNNDLLALITPADNSDCSFFYPEILLEMNPEKLKEALIETYFRIILNLYDAKLSDRTIDLLVTDAKYIRETLRRLQAKKKGLTEKECDRLALIIVRTVDGTTYLPEAHQWNWYFLETALYAEFRTKRSEGLAVLAPIFFREGVKHSDKFKERTVVLANKLFDRESVDGFVLELMHFASEFNLPQAYLDMHEIRELTPHNLVNVIRNGTYFVPAKITKKVLEGISLY